MPGLPPETDPNDPATAPISIDFGSHRTAYASIAQMSDPLDTWDLLMLQGPGTGIVVVKIDTRNTGDSITPSIYGSVDGLYFHQTAKLPTVAEDSTAAYIWTYGRGETIGILALDDERQLPSNGKQRGDVTEVLAIRLVPGSTAELGREQYILARKCNTKVF